MQEEAIALYCGWFEGFHIAIHCIVLQEKKLVYCNGHCIARRLQEAKVYRNTKNCIVTKGLGCWARWGVGQTLGRRWARAERAGGRWGAQAAGARGACVAGGRHGRASAGRALERGEGGRRAAGRGRRATGRGRRVTGLGARGRRAAWALGARPGLGMCTRCT